jgi:hypothetical protein
MTGRMIVPSVWIKTRRMWRWSHLGVSMRLIDIGVGVSRVIVTERDAFEVIWRAADVIGLTERNIVRWLTFQYEICGLFGRK